ncbi:2028_t:CDS:2 [Gigaspora margarita]|uniref:2028_t:CDS:1 n=1 Tax=Gigaspora margarita TaxID=4874 RepID=A0ABM8VVE0_GIGMA|nr:2028_t:CDS:2 [Gigaspora margarita]
MYSKTIYLSKFTFSESIKFITKKNDITFTLYGYCVDNSCTKPSLVNNFDKLPSSSEITGKSLNQNRLEIPIPSIPTPSISNVPSSIEPAVSAFSSAITNGANTAANTAKDIAAIAPGLLSQLLSAFDNFKPRSPTANVSALLILTSSILNIIACFFDLLLFVWVFDLISIIPGIGSQNTGPGIYLATISASFLTAATILLCITTVSSTTTYCNRCDAQIYVNNHFNLCGICESERARFARQSNPLNLNLQNVPQNSQERNDLSQLENKIDHLQEQVTQLIELQKDLDRKILDNMISNEKEKK